MSCYELIAKTKRKKKLSDDEIKWLVASYVNDEIPDYQMSAWLMAVCFNSLSEAETAALTLAMRDSGDMVDLSGVNGITADKHSTGGVGDKTTLVTAPIVAACEVCVPKMSGRGLGFTGGTIDKLESIQGFSTSLSHDKFIEVVNEAGLSIISQSGKIVPADKKIYSLRSATATVDSIPLICSSIMSKKLAMGADCIMLDVKTGSGAFMKTYEGAEMLAKEMVKTAKYANKRCMAIISDMGEPLGESVGNASEVIEALEILKGNKKGRLYELCIELAAGMIEMAKGISHKESVDMAVKAIEKGAALERFEKMVYFQGGDTRVISDYSFLPQPRYRELIYADKSGYISEINSELIGITSMNLGAGRKKKEDNIDMSAGIGIYKHIGEYVSKGEAVAEIYTSSMEISDYERNMCISAFKFSDEKIKADENIVKRAIS